MKFVWSEVSIFTLLSINGRRYSQEATKRVFFLSLARQYGYENRSFQRTLHACRPTTLPQNTFWSARSFQRLTVI
jgi:hypothetical protein